MPSTEEVSAGLAEHVPGYHAYLLGLGYSRSAAKKHRQLAVHLSKWLELHDVAVCDLTATATEGFFGALSTWHAQLADPTLARPATHLPARLWNPRRAGSSIVV